MRDIDIFFQVREWQKHYVLKVFSFTCEQEHKNKQKDTIKILTVLTVPLGLLPAIKLFGIVNFGCCLTSKFLLCDFKHLPESISQFPETCN